MFSEEAPAAAGIGRENRLSLTYKILVDVTGKPYAGCAVSNGFNGDLIGLMFSETDRTVRFLNVQLTDRNRRKLRSHKLR